MTALESWRYGDPAVVYERLEARNNRLREKRKIESPFEDDMGRKLDIPGHVTHAMYQWGQWARRPQFWTNLGVTPFCKLVGIGGGRPQSDVLLDPQSMAIHKAVMRVDDKTKAVLYTYYVACETWRQHKILFERHGISEDTFHRRLKTGSISVANAANLT